MKLLKPTINLLMSYKDALERGWSADNTRPIESPKEELAMIEKDPLLFLNLMEDTEAKGGPITLADGSQVPRLPSFRRWMWDDNEFCGSIGFRWQHRTPVLPPHCLGHIGYGVVPWREGRGYAKQGLALMLIQAKAASELPYVELVTDPDNRRSQRVIEANGGKFIEEFDKGAAYGHKKGYRYRISL